MPTSQSRHVNLIRSHVYSAGHRVGIATHSSQAVHSFRGCLLSNFFMPDSVLGVGDTAVSRPGILCLRGAHSPFKGADNKKQERKA